MHSYNLLFLHISGAQFEFPHLRPFDSYSGATMNFMPLAHNSTTLPSARSAQPCSSAASMPTFAAACMANGGRLDGGLVLVLRGARLIVILRFCRVAPGIFDRHPGGIHRQRRDGCLHRLPHIDVTAA